MQEVLLEQAIEEAQKHLDGRETRRLIAWAIITLLVFFIPIVLYYKLSSGGGVMESSYAPIVIVWLMISLGVSNMIATALLAARTVELKLQLATSSSLLMMIRGGVSEAKSQSDQETSDKEPSESAG